MNLSRISDEHRHLAGVKSTGDEVQMGNVQQHDGIRPRPDHYNNQRTPGTTTFYCRNGKPARPTGTVSPLHRRQDQHN